MRTMTMAQHVIGVIPMLICRDGAAEIEFCARAFGAIELSRRAAADAAGLLNAAVAPSSQALAEQALSHVLRLSGSAGVRP
jgi:hypothetical protein